MVLRRMSASSAWLYCCSGLGRHSAKSRGMDPSSVWTSSSMETVLLVLRLRRRMRLSLTAMRTSQVENLEFPWNWSSFS